MIEESWYPTDPESQDKVVRQFQEILERAAREYPVACAWGYCTYFVDPLTNKVGSGWGAVGCGCDNLPGRTSKYMAGKPKPSVPVKAKGRHGSRVQRSRARKAEWNQWMKELEN